MLQQGKVGSIIGAIFQWNVQIALLFMKRIIVVSMHTESKYPCFFFKQTCSTITLVDIQIYDQDLARQLFVQQIIGRYGKIIQQTKTFTMVCKSMVGAARRIHG